MGGNVPVMVCYVRNTACTSVQIGVLPTMGFTGMASQHLVSYQ